MLGEQKLGAIWKYHVLPPLNKSVKLVLCPEVLVKNCFVLSKKMKISKISRFHRFQIAIKISRFHEFLQEIMKSSIPDLLLHVPVPHRRTRTHSRVAWLTRGRWVR